MISRESTVRKLGDSPLTSVLSLESKSHVLGVNENQIPSNADSKNSIDSRHAGQSDARDMDLVMRHMLPGLVDLATAMAQRIRADCSSVVEEQKWEEYEIYANENREDFIRKLAEEAWPRALQDVNEGCSQYYQNEK